MIGTNTYYYGARESVIEAAPTSSIFFRKQVYIVCIIYFKNVFLRNSRHHLVYYLNKIGDNLNTHTYFE